MYRPAYVMLRSRASALASFAEMTSISRSGIIAVGAPPRVADQIRELTRDRRIGQRAEHVPEDRVERLAADHERAALRGVRHIGHPPDQRRDRLTRPFAPRPQVDLGGRLAHSAGRSRRHTRATP